MNCMQDISEIRKNLWEIRSEEEFCRIALDLFHFQYDHVPVYKEFCDQLGRSNPKTLEEIPFLPIEFFKTQKILTSGKKEELIFKSSGTTGSIRSHHYVTDLSLYEESFMHCFEQFFGAVKGKVILALLPNYLEQGNSSLVYMVDYLIRASENERSGFFLYNHEELLRVIEQAKKAGEDVILFGVSYALLDLAEKRINLEGVRIIETGGMKGRRKEMIKEELHRVLCEGLGVETISSEYGMTELLSQAYSFRDGVFSLPPWMKIRIRDTEDPLSWMESGRTGGISVIDLANIYSCSFIHTQDLGKIVEGGFRIMGRFDNSDIRGCNLLVNN